jgi:tellurite resistance protein TehA-like permease
MNVINIKRITKVITILSASMWIVISIVLLVINWKENVTGMTDQEFEYGIASFIFSVIILSYALTDRSSQYDQVLIIENDIKKYKEALELKELRRKLSE